MGMVCTRFCYGLDVDVPISILCHDIAMLGFFWWAGFGLAGVECCESIYTRHPDKFLIVVTPAAKSRRIRYDGIRQIWRDDFLFLLIGIANILLLPTRTNPPTPTVISSNP